MGVFLLFPFIDAAYIFEFFKFFCLLFLSLIRSLFWGGLPKQVMATRSAETTNPNGITTSWVPFTTPGPSLSPECLSAFYLNPQNAASIGAFDPWYGQNVNTSLQCQAPQLTTWWDQADLSASTLWNLGPLACPNEYTTGSTQSVNPQSTILACCPS
jgi:hypothetical protein